MTSPDDLDPMRRRLTDLTRVAAGDEPAWSPDTDAILEQGRRAVRRQRISTAVAGACGVAVVTTVAYAVPGTVTGVDAPSAPAESAPATIVSAAPRTPSPEPAGDWREALETFGSDEVLARCRAQVREVHPDIPADEWQFTEPGDDRRGKVAYRLGDQLAVAAGEVWETCTVLGGWQPDPPVDFTAPAPPATDHGAILQACSATVGVDLGAWEVRAAMADGVGGLSAVLASPDTDPYVAACELQPSSWDTGLGSGARLLHAPLSEIHAEAADDPVAWRLSIHAAHTCVKSVSPCEGGMYSGAGVLSEEVASLEFELPGDQVIDVPVEDGLYAFRAVDGVSEGGLSDVWISVYNSNGELLERFTAW